MKFDANLAVKLMEIDKVIPYEQNPRINDKAVDAVMASLQEFGFRQPIVLDANNIIIAGHTRLKAAKKLGLAKVPVHIARDLSESQIKAFRIADNKTAELAEWDFDMLAIELSELAEDDYDMDVLGFDERELTKLLESEIAQGNTDPDEVPEPPDEPVTQSGDIWLLGEHRLMCGDSGSPEDLDKLLDGSQIDLLVCDPPYGVSVEPRSNNAIAAGNSSFAASGSSTGKMRAKDRPIENDSIKGEDFEITLSEWFSNAARVLKPGRGFYIFGGYANLTS